MYQELVGDSRKIIIANQTNPTEPRLRMLNIFKLLQEILIRDKTKQAEDTKSETIPEESEKHDVATGGKDIPDLETEEETEKRQKAQGLKIMTPSQLITRLPILLAQFNAGNNSNKLENETRQIVYSLYRSKNLSKTIYNHLIDSI